MTDWEPHLPVTVGLATVTVKGGKKQGKHMKKQSSKESVQKARKASKSKGTKESGLKLQSLSPATICGTVEWSFSSFWYAAHYRNGD